MPIYKIKISKSSLKFIKTRTKEEQKRIFSEIYKLPYNEDIKKMKGFLLRYRLRIGNIRVIYDKFDDVLEILVVKIGNRGDVYK